MVKQYITAKKLGTGVAKIRTLNPYGKGVLEVPTLEEFSRLLQRSENIALSK